MGQRYGEGVTRISASVDVDSAGDVFLTWAVNPPDKSNNPTGLNKVYLDMSRDGGMTWLPHPIVVAQASKVKGPHRGTVLWPWVAAGSKGNVSVVWYQMDRMVDPDCDIYNGQPVTAVKTFIYEAHITNATNAATRAGLRFQMRTG